MDRKEAIDTLKEYEPFCTPQAMKEAIRAAVEALEAAPDLEKEKETNADKIREMSDEELASIIYQANASGCSGHCSECKKIEEQGNAGCYRCDLCMMKQYLKKVRNGETPRVAKDNNGSSYPTIN